MYFSAGEYHLEHWESSDSSDKLCIFYVRWLCTCLFMLPLARKNTLDAYHHCSAFLICRPCYISRSNFIWHLLPVVAIAHRNWPSCLIDKVLKQSAKVTYQQIAPMMLKVLRNIDHHIKTPKKNLTFFLPNFRTYFTGNIYVTGKA